MRRFILASAAVCALAAPSVAMAQAAQNFTGPRAELRLGADRAELDGLTFDGTTIDRAKGGQTEFTYGAEAGYDINVENLVVGAYGGVDLSNAKACGSALGGGDQMCLKTGRDITLGLRAGLPVTERTLAYVKGGYSNNRPRLSYDNPAAPGTNLVETRSRDGWHAGAGGEFLINENLYAKAEYTFSEFDTIRGFSGGNYAEADPRRHQLTVGVGMRF